MRAGRRHDPVNTRWPVREAPLLAVAAIAGLGLLAVALHYWRKGLYVIGVALLVGAALRLLLPARRAGLLAVRSRTADVTTLALLGAAIVILAAVVPPVRALPRP